MSWLLVCLVTVSLVGRSLSYPTGAPLEACSTLAPLHDNSNQTASNSGYTIQTEPAGSNQLRVTLASSTAPFKGFILAADDPSGTFTPEDTTAQILKCKDQPTVTHTSGLAKFRVSVLWQRNQEALGKVNFYATVVTGYDENYVAGIKYSYSP